MCLLLRGLAGQLATAIEAVATPADRTFAGVGILWDSGRVLRTLDRSEALDSLRADPEVWVWVHVRYTSTAEPRLTDVQPIEDDETLFFYAGPVAGVDWLDRTHKTAGQSRFVSWVRQNAAWLSVGDSPPQHVISLYWTGMTAGDTRWP